ncbi:MAG: glutamate--cysteine ligase [Aeromicrobium sp.]|nr:glutamate--cysteine ligase [Aeromicrobium sp.]
METEELRRQVSELFSGGPRSTRIGVEHELIASDVMTGTAVSIERVRAATAHAAYSPYLGFEPGGQVELSLPVASDPTTLARDLTAAVAALRTDCAAAGIRLRCQPVDSRTAGSVPLQLTSPRYLAMQNRFDSIGPAGRRMMRSTASTQLCLDWWSGDVGLDQWRLLNLAGPLLAAAFARSTGADSRLATWLAVDPTRTAFDDRLILGDPVAAYADFAAGAVPFAEAGDVAQHLTTLFPPVRPRGRYLEVRFLDVQPATTVALIAKVLSTLMYDGECRTRALAFVADDAGRLADRWAQAAHGDARVIARGSELVDLALSSGQRPKVLAGVGGAA